MSPQAVRLRPAAPVLVTATLAAAGVGVLAAWMTGGLVAQPLGDPGPLTRWGLPAVRAAGVVTGALTVGLLVVVAAIAPPASARTRREPEPDMRGAQAVGAARASMVGAAWVVCSAVTLVLTYADVAGVPVGQMGAPGTGAGLVSFVRDVDTGRALGVALVLAMAATLLTGVATRVTTVGIAAVLAIAALVPPAFTGHAAGAANHEAAVDTQVVHLVALSTWFGGLGALVALRKAAGADLPVMVRRFSTVAFWAFLAVALSGVAGALVRLEGLQGLISTYGVLLGLKTAALALLASAGWVHRRRLVARLERGEASARAFWALVSGELVVLGVASGLGVALARTSPPVAEVQEDSTTTLLGYAMPPPLQLERWFDTWRVDTVWAPVAAVAVTLYLTALLRLRRRGDHWPLPRTALWVLGWVVLVWATSGAPKVYGRVLFSMHMVEHMTIGTLVPILLVLGAPITLVLRAATARTDGSRGLREWTLVLVHSRSFRVLGHPVVAPVLFVGSLIAFYYTPALELSLRTHAGHVLMTAHFLVAGYLFAWVICGPDPGPRRPLYPIRLLILIATMAFHAFFGIAMMSAVEPLAGDWYSALDRPWGPALIEDQRRAGAIAWGLGDYPVAILAIAMAAAWIRDDARETRRYDRRADRDGDTELLAWNSMLQHHKQRHAETGRSARRED